MTKGKTMNPKKLALATAVLAACGLAQAQSAAGESPWLVRARVVNIDPVNKSDPIGGAGPADQIGVSSKAIPEVDVSYFFTRNIAAELILTYPQKHDVTLAGAPIGSFKHLPPTLTLQYHFMPEKQLSPYLGAGLNYTRISSVNLAAGAVTLEKSSTGLALQAGVDYKIDRHWSLNLDVKKVQLRTDVFAAGAKVSNLKLDPLLVAVGVGYRF